MGSFKFLAKSDTCGNTTAISAEMYAGFISGSGFRHSGVTGIFGGLRSKTSDNNVKSTIDLRWP